MARRRNPTLPYVHARIDKDVMCILDDEIRRDESLSEGLLRLLRRPRL